MKEITKNNFCQIYAENEFQAKTRELDDLIPGIDFIKLDSYTKFVLFELNLEFPFEVPENNIFFIKVISNVENYGVYLDKIAPLDNIQLKIKVDVPSRYPTAFIWNFYLYLPEESAVCSWDEIELMPFKDENYPRSWRIKLLDYSFEERGDFRTTIFEPLN